MRRGLLEAHDLSTFRTLIQNAERGVKSDYTRDFFIRKRPQQKSAGEFFRLA
jgi:hypothetical protein